MFKEERYHEILTILEREKYCSAAELSQKLYVSLPTIRRDLTELQRRGQIVRSHGGAGIIRHESTVAPLDFRKTLNSDKKRQLCKAAASLVHENDIVFIDSSTTTLQMADFLDAKSRITVITNGIPLATLLAKKGIKTYCTGGEIFENSLAHFGSFAENFIRNFNIDTMFVSCHGVNENGILTDPSLPETQIRKVAFGQAKQSVFLCDESKLNAYAPYNFIHVNQFDHIVTNTDAIRRYLSPEEEAKLIIVSLSL